MRHLIVVLLLLQYAHSLSSVRGSSCCASRKFKLSVADDVTLFYEESDGEAGRALREELKMSKAPRLPFLEVLPQSAATMCQELREQGCVKLVDLLSKEQVAALLLSVNAQLADSIDAAPQLKEMNSFFANSKSQANRWDLKLKYSDEVKSAMRSLLSRSSLLSETLLSLVGGQGRVVELAAFVTIEGAGRQIIHSDTPFSRQASHYTCTVALQDIDEAMGPTVFIPRTHTEDAYLERLTEYMDAAFMSDDDSALLDRPHTLSLLTSGSAALYDSRLLHCGGANRSPRTRVLFYFTMSSAAHEQEGEDEEEGEGRARSALEKSIGEETANLALTLDHFRSFNYLYSN